MKLPFISRALHETILGIAQAHAESLQQRITDLCAELVRERERSHSLAERALQMRKEGFEPPPPPPPEPETPFPEVVLKAIAERAFDPIMERRNIAYARQALTTMDPETVAANILAGEQVEDEL